MGGLRALAFASFSIESFSFRAASFRWTALLVWNAFALIRVPVCARFACNEWRRAVLLDAVTDRILDPSSLTYLLRAFALTGVKVEVLIWWALGDCLTFTFAGLKVELFIGRAFGDCLAFTGAGFLVENLIRITAGTASFFILNNFVDQ